MWLMFIMNLFQTEAHPEKKKKKTHKILEMSAIEAALSDQMMKPSARLSFHAGHRGAPSSLFIKNFYFSAKASREAFTDFHRCFYIFNVLCRVFFRG